MLLVVLHTLSVNKGNGVHNKVAMQVLGVQVGCYHNLKSVAPHTLGKFRPDLLCQFGSDIRFVLKAQIPVIGLDTVAFVELLLDRYELVTGGRDITVNAAYIKLSLGLFLVLGVLQNIGKRLILLRRIFFCRRLFGIGRIVNHLVKAGCHFPYLAYCHFISLFSGRRNCRSTSA